MDCACQVLGQRFQPTAHRIHQQFSRQVQGVAAQLGGWASSRIQPSALTEEQEDRLLAEILAYSGELDDFAQELIARSRAHLESEVGATYSRDVAAVSKQLMDGKHGSTR